MDVFRYTGSSGEYGFTAEATQESDGLFLYSDSDGLELPTNAGNWLIYGGPNATVAPVPEPSTLSLALFGLGLALIHSLRRR